MATEWREKFAETCSKTFTEQGIWYLNGFWDEGAKDEAEQVWTMVHQFIEVAIDRPKRYGKLTDEIEEPCDLDEFKAHRILEMMGETLTVIELRKRLKALDLDCNNKMSLMEYLVDKYHKTPAQIAEAKQGVLDPKQLAEAQEAVDSASAAFAKADEDAAAAAKALEQSVVAAAAAADAKAEAEASLKSAEEAEAEVKAAEAENEAALNEIVSQEKAKEDKIAACKAILDDDSIGQVKKGQAKQEMEATLAEDPLPLNRARLTQKAALKKVTAARKKAEAATAVAKAAAAAATKAKEEADAAAAVAAETKETADAAAAAAAAAEQEAQAKLEELKIAGGCPMGKLWWMERVLEERKKFMRKKK